MLSEFFDLELELCIFLKLSIVIPVFASSRLADRQVRDIHWPEDSLLVAIRRGEHEIIPHGDTLVRPGDTLVIVADQSCRLLVQRRLTQTNTADF
ncbi:MAG: TrkA C-terminal domain-containing protein [Sporolactobacillus sp.]